MGYWPAQHAVQPIDRAERAVTGRCLARCQGIYSLLGIQGGRVMRVVTRPARLLRVTQQHPALRVEQRHHPVLPQVIRPEDIGDAFVVDQHVGHATELPIAQRQRVDDREHPFACDARANRHAKDQGLLLAGTVEELADLQALLVGEINVFAEDHPAILIGAANGTGVRNALFQADEVIRKALPAELATVVLASEFLVGLFQS